MRKNEREAVGRRCSALLVLGLGEERGFGWGFFLAIAFLGTLGAARSGSERLGFFEGGGFLDDSFFGSTRSSSEHSDFLRLGIFGSTRSSSEHSECGGKEKGGSGWGGAFGSL